MDRKPSLLRGLATGAAADLAGSLMIAGFQELVAKTALSRTSEDAQHAHAPQPGKENTTEKAARKVMAQFGRRLETSDKQIAGRALHYGFGLVMGAFYGVASEYLPIVGWGGGTAFGTILFAATDQAALPALKLASQPAATPAVDHLLHWASHLVYASTLEATRKQLVRLS